MINKKEFFKKYLNCRRGILELDILLIKFLENRYKTLNNDDLKFFEVLLKESDSDLYKYLIMGKTHENKNINETIKKIRHSANILNF